MAMSFLGVSVNAFSERVNFDADVSAIRLYVSQDLDKSA